MLFYVYFDGYGNARKAIGQEELAEKYDNDRGEFLKAMGALESTTGTTRTAGHVGTFRFENERELREALDTLGDEIEGFYGCASDSRPYNF